MTRTALRTLAAAALFLLISVIGAAPARAAWEVALKGDATFELKYDGQPVVTAGWPAWGANWKYAGTRLSRQDQEGALRRYTGQVPAVTGIPADVPLQVSVQASGDNRLLYTITASPAQPLRGIVGFTFAVNFPNAGTVLGYEPSFTFQYPGGRSVTMTPSEGGGAVIEPSDPELSGKPKTGFVWNLPGRQSIKLEFDRPVQATLERKDLQLRIWYVKDGAPAGEQSLRVAVTLPRGTRLAQTLAEKYGPADTGTWVRDALHWDTSPVDLSFLNDKPAGKHGFLTVKGDEFVFEDGTPVRFWAGNLAARALFSDKESMPAQARRIARMGFNLMRIHHHDSTRWVSPTVIDKSQPTSQVLDEEGMDKLDYLISCLKKEGVYVWLDLHVGREFKTADNIPGFAEMDRDGNGKAEGKGFCYYNERIEQLMKEFNQKYLSHMNPYTGLAFKDDPAIMGMLVTNEDDLTSHFGNAMLPDKHHPYHNKLFDARVRAWCERTGYPYEDSWKTWLPGPSKRYLNFEQTAWQDRMTSHLRSIGVRVPVVANQFWSGMGMWDLPALATSDMIDVHSYGGGDTLPLSVSPVYGSNFVIRITAGQVAGKPVTITEWHTPYPTSWRSISPMYVAAVGSLQGWDAPMLYNYSQDAFRRPDRPRTWTSYYEPGIMAPMPAAALAFRRGDFQQARQTALIKLSEEQTYNQGLSDGNMTALRTLAEQHKIAIAPGTQPQGVRADIVVSDPAQNFIPDGQNWVRSDTGQIYRNWAAGIETFNSPRTQGAQGFIGYGDNGKLIRLDSVQMSVTNPFGVLLVSSLDGKPIEESAMLLVTAIGRTADSGGRLPMLSEPLTASLSIKSSVAGMKFVPLGPAGEPLSVNAVPYVDGAYTVRLTPALKTHWFLLQQAR